jgi:hypothetical protein
VTAAASGMEDPQVIIAESNGGGERLVTSKREVIVAGSIAILAGTAVCALFLTPSTAQAQTCPSPPCPAPPPP